MVYNKKIKSLLTVAGLVLTSFAQADIKSLVDCYIVNEKYIASEEELIIVPQVEIDVGYAVPTKIFSSEEIELFIENNIVINLNSDTPWVTAFTVLVKKKNGQELLIRSSQREDSKGEMYTHFSLRRDGNEGSFTIECNGY